MLNVEPAVNWNSFSSNDMRLKLMVINGTERLRDSSKYLSETFPLTAFRFPKFLVNRATFDFRDRFHTKLVHLSEYNVSFFFIKGTSLIRNRPLNLEV